LRRDVPADALRRRLLAFRVAAATHRQAQHVQVTVIHLLAAEILQRPALAVVMAAVDLVPEHPWDDARRDSPGARDERDSARAKRRDNENDSRDDKGSHDLASCGASC